ncbi:hypothetical protein [Bosea sp. PAMC 26642]|uniref:hypothetical protein n=1 Tax=Bosea sp. (strain PAMC 26642) TaxID=1792307 RepID=UPI0014390162|nr:hypothetical protein [Bosea sp. PAMC 26642]
MTISRFLLTLTALAFTAGHGFAQTATRRPRARPPLSRHRPHRHRLRRPSPLR